MNRIINFFRRSATIKRLEAENIDLKAKLLAAQEHLNKTNAYWKKKLYHAKNSKTV